MWIWQAGQSAAFRREAALGFRLGLFVRHGAWARSRIESSTSCPEIPRMQDQHHLGKIGFSPSRVM